MHDDDVLRHPWLIELEEGAIPLFVPVLSKVPDWIEKAWLR
jgi:hypothetical protein